MERNVKLTSAEIASLWTSYMNDSMSKCILSYMLKYIEDEEIKVIVEFALEIADRHLETLQTLFIQEQYAKPEGFTDEDVNMNAPWLFTDVFCLTYVHQMGRVGLLAYAGFVSMSIRKDIRDYYTKGMTETLELYNRSTNIGLEKGIIASFPFVGVPQSTDYIDSKKYYSGLNPFNSKRPLNVVEISNLYMNTMTNSMGVKLCLAFAQTSPRKEVQEFMLRGKEISQKHITIFSNILLEDEIETPQLPDLSISNSVTPTFSDKLLMFHMSLLSSAGIGNYATAAAASQRSDLAMNYERLSIEIARYAKSGADLMIEHAWLEQPPETTDRIKLAKTKMKE